MAQDLNAVLEGILKNPDFQKLASDLGKTPDGEDPLSRLPKMLATVAPLLEGKKEEEKVEMEIRPSAQKLNKNNAERLLTALKPYLSENRRALVDQCVNVLQIGDLVSALGLPDGAPKLGGSA